MWELTVQLVGPAAIYMVNYSQLLPCFVCRWNPDRFAPSGKRGNEFCPFGIHSRRKCPGYLFSYFEVTVFVAVLLQRYTHTPSCIHARLLDTCIQFNLNAPMHTYPFRFEVVPVEGQDVGKVYGLITEPKEEIYVYLHQRR